MFEKYQTVPSKVNSNFSYKPTLNTPFSSSVEGPDQRRPRR